MIDWIQAVLPFRHTGEIMGGLVQATDDAGELQWQRRKHVSIAGSFSTTIALRSQGQVGPDEWSEVYISGNPLKFLQGHNAFGSDDLQCLLALMASDALTLAGKPVTIFDQRRWLEGRGVKVTMVDITYMFDLPSRADVRTYLRALGHTGHMRHRGRGEFRHETLYFGRRSRRHALKVYCKADELECRKKGHQLPAVFQAQALRRDGERIHAWCDTKLRYELRLLPMELKRLQLDNAELWQLPLPAELFRIYTDRLSVSPQQMKEADVLTKLTSAQRSAYTLWKKGEDVRRVYSRSQYYKLRRALLEHGVDIGVTQAPAQDRNVVQMVRILQPKPADVPEWAKGGRHVYADTNAARRKVKGDR